jgi:hypothetical protein
VDTTLEGSKFVDKMPVDLRGIVSDKSYATYSHYSKLGEPLAISLYRRWVMQGRELLSHHFVVDDVMNHLYHL